MQIEPATPGDLGEIARVWHRSWLSSTPQDTAAATISDLERRLRHEEWELYILRENAAIVAFLALDIGSNTLAQMFVEPACQRRGLGRFLLHHAGRRMPEGFILRTDETNAGAKRFYEKNGLVLEKSEAGRAHYRWRPD